MRFHAQGLPLGGTGGPLHGCRRSRGSLPRTRYAPDRSSSQNERRKGRTATARTGHTILSTATSLLTARKVSLSLSSSGARTPTILARVPPINRAQRDRVGPSPRRDAVARSRLVMGGDECRRGSRLGTAAASLGSARSSLTAVERAATTAEGRVRGGPCPVAHQDLGGRLRNLHSRPGVDTRHLGHGQRWTAHHRYQRVLAHGGAFSRD